MIYVAILLSALLAVGGAFWFALTVIGHISGWKSLALRFPPTEPPSGRCFGMQSLKLGGIGYNGCMSVYRNEAGLHLYPWRLFQIGHPPLLIPWTEIHRPVETQFLGSRFVTVDIGHPAIARLQLAAKVLAG